MLVRAGSPSFKWSIDQQAILHLSFLLYRLTLSMARSTNFLPAPIFHKKGRPNLKAEHSFRRSTPRYAVTKLDGNKQDLYDNLYCARGDMENRIKEQQLGLFTDRTSCHKWWPNQFRLLVSSIAYVLLESIRRLYLSGTELGS